MKNDAAEVPICGLVHDWAELRGLKRGQSEAPDFSDFYSWPQDKYLDLLDFRTPCCIDERVGNGTVALTLAL
jgi:hypothetical protein